MATSAGRSVELSTGHAGGRAPAAPIVSRARPSVARNPVAKRPQQR